jgi:hypothetical protein
MEQGQTMKSPFDCAKFTVRPAKISYVQFGQNEQTAAD